MSAESQRALLVLKHGEKRVLIPRPTTYDNALDAACRHFPSVSRDAIRLQTKDLDVCGGHLADITAESWDLLVNLISVIEVTGPSSPTTSPQIHRVVRPPVNNLSGMVLRKPVIYLYSPTDIDVSIKLSLSHEWRFSAIYPVVIPKINEREQIEWNVGTHLDGTLTEKITGLNVSFLFWEAEITPGALPSLSHSPAFGQLQQAEYFNPALCDLCDTDSVVLSVDKVTSYLDRSLQALGLHIEARTSFITYWLPSIQKHKYIALRFVPQPAYERAAPLEINPQPDVVTRVFMLFKGVEEDQLAAWSGARATAEKDVALWEDVVGVQLARASDTNLFRVLEWGGMEVLRA